MQNLSSTQLAAIGAARQRIAWEQSVLSDFFPEQLNLHESPARFKASPTGRRGGKSEFISRSAVLNAMRGNRDEYVVILAETLKKCKALHWNKFASVVGTHGLPFVPNASSGTWTAPFGATVIFLGLDDTQAVQLLRGYKIRTLYADEVASFAHMLPVLVKEVVKFALGDTRGQLYLLGTPSSTRAGGWFEICDGKDKSSWEQHRWTLYDNPFFPEAQAFVEDYCREEGVTIDDPIVQREIFGLFVNDPASRVYHYVTGELNNVTDFDRSQLSYGHCTMGVDFGTTNDPCAWTVLWSEHGSDVTYVLESRKEYRLLPDEASVITKHLADKYQAAVIVGDAGGLGAVYIEHHNRRYADTTGYYIHPAEKLGKIGGIKLFNGELRSGRVKLLPEAAPLAKEALELPWKDPTKPTEEHPSYDNHCLDSALYAFRSHLPTLTKTKPVEKTAEELQHESAMARKQQTLDQHTTHWQTRPR